MTVINEGLHATVCDCGDCKAAIDEALAELQAMLASGKCLHWAGARLSAWLSVVYVLSLGDETLPPNMQVRPRLERLNSIIGGDAATLEYIIDRVDAILAVETPGAQLN